MVIRPLWCWLALACLGSHAMVDMPALSPDQERAALLWQKGQDSMRRGDQAQAVRCYEQSLALDPALTRNYLSLAAAFLETGDEESACGHLRRYVFSNPEKLDIRIHLANLELRLEHWAEARRQFERCVACAQDATEPTYGELLHCHARLMEIAETVEDFYQEHLHRGIGLCLLARQRSILPDPEGDLATESLLCKAAGELTLAQGDRPGQARPSWYLYNVWSMLDQQSPALRCLRQAADAAPFTGDLTTTERRQLQCQCQCASVESPKR